MQVERRIIYMGNNNPFEIYCQEEDIEMEIKIKLRQFEDNEIQYCKIGDQNSQNYIVYSLPILTKQNDEFQQISKQNQEQQEKIKELQNQLEMFKETQKQDQLFKQLTTEEYSQLKQRLKDAEDQKKLNLQECKEREEQIKIGNELRMIFTQQKEIKKMSKEIEVEKEQLKNKSIQLENKSKELEVYEEQLTNESIQLENLKEEQYKKYQLQDINDLREENKKLKQELESHQQKNDKYINSIHEEHYKKDNLIIQDLEKQIEGLKFELSQKYSNGSKFDLSQKCLNGSKIKNLCNNQIREQLALFQEQLNFKLSEVFLNENDNLSQISCDNLSEKFIQEFSEQDYDSALKEQFDELPFQSQVLQLNNLQFVLKIKQVPGEKMTLSQIQDQIFNNLLCQKLMKLFFLDKKAILDSQRVRIPRQFILKVSNGNYYYCEEFIKGEPKIFSVKNNQQIIDNLDNQFFLYCYNQTNKKKIFTQMSYNQNDHIVYNIIGYDNFSIFKTREIIAQLNFFLKLLNEAKSVEDTTFS